MSARHPLVSFFVSLVLAALALGCGAESTAGDAPVGFKAIDTDVFQPACTFACHSGGDFAAGGLDMGSDTYTSLVGVVTTASACDGTGILRVAPGDPEASALYQKVQAKLTGEPPPCGDVMPQGPDRPALSPADVDRIRAWIEAGAADD